MIAGIAGLIAVAAFALVVSQLSAAKQGPAGATAGTTPNEDMAVTDYPSAALPGTGLYYPDPAALLSSTWYSTVKLPRGQLVLTTQLTQVLAPEKLPPVQLTDGNVAMSVPYDESKDAAGFIQQDDFIDILVDDPVSKVVHYAFQGVHVLRVGDRASQPTGASPAAVAASDPAVLLVELPREQAAALAFAIDQNFTIRYLIRPHDQQTQTPLPNSGPVGQSNWLTVISS
jgi:Flp pilus assembly protein CpaB